MTKKNETDVNAIEVAEKEIDLAPGFASMQSFEFALQAARVLSESTLVPKEYRGNIANCVIALNMAARLKADPLMVMQNLYIVYGRPGWSSQFLIAMFNTSGKFSPLRYEWVGEPGTDDWGCRAWATELATGEKVEGALVTLGLAKKEGWFSRDGNKWRTMPEQMLMYRSASWFIRVYAPELAMGMYTAEEIIDLGEDEYRVHKKAVEPNSEELDIVEEEEEEKAKEKEPGF